MKGSRFRLRACARKRPGLMPGALVHLPVPGPYLVGRSGEGALLDGLPAGVRAGESEALVIRGEAGWLSRVAATPHAPQRQALNTALGLVGGQVP